MITERQREILNSVVQEYIGGAEPVSSQLLEKKHKFGICSATIRIEMQKLTDKGYLYQLHTSAGRIPTDRGYRFFVDELLEGGLGGWKKDFGIDREAEAGDALQFTRTITKFLASESSNLALSYLSTEGVLWKEGWREILQEPEFEESGFASRFAQILDDFEKNIESLFFEFPSEIHVYIGKENPFSKARDFSIITARCRFPQKQEGVLTILGPKRMAYDKNINLIDSAIKLLENY